MKSDLEGNLAKPKSAIGMIVAALRQRREQGTRSFTVLSCDNLPENGDKVNTDNQHNQHNQHKCQCTEGLYVCSRLRGRVLYLRLWRYQCMAMSAVSVCDR